MDTNKKGQGETPQKKSPKQMKPQKTSGKKNDLKNKLNPTLVKAFKERSDELKSKVQKDQLEEKIKHYTNSPIKAIFPAIMGIVIVLLIMTYFSGQDKTIKQTVVPRIEAKGKKASTPNDSILPKELSIVEESYYTKTPSDPLLAGGFEGVQQQELASIKHKLPLEIKDQLGISFRLIPDGQFLMGSAFSKRLNNSDEYQHQKVLKYPFYMGKYEVTVEQWLKVMGELPYNSTKKPANPVTGTSLNDCLKFVQKLNTLIPKGANYKYFIPSESEWEYACRAGTEKNLFYGHEIVVDEYVVHRENTRTGNVEPVGSKRPNPWGLYDVYGNASEWTRTPHFLYACNQTQYAGTTMKDVESLKKKLNNMTLESRQGSYRNYFNYKYKVKSDEELLFLSCWDKPIYDGDHPENLISPLDKFNVPLRAFGKNLGLYYYDSNKNGIYSKNEAIWADHPDKGTQQHFDEEFDTVIVSYGKKIPEGYKGLQNDIYYHDKNQSFDWNPGEEIWAYNQYGRKYSNKSEAPYILRGSSYVFYSNTMRSSARYQMKRQNAPTYSGLRICLYLNRFPYQESNQPGDNSTPFD